MSVLRRVVPTLAVVALMAGCTHSINGRPDRTSQTKESNAASTAPTRQEPPPLAVGWRTHGVHPVSHVVVLGRTALVYGITGKQLYLYGIAARGGAVLWRHAASTSATTQGVVLEVVTAGTNVAYFGPLDRARGRDAQLIAADAESGRVRASTPRLEWTGSPHACDRHPADPCATSYQPGPHANIEFRLNVRNRVLQAVPGVGAGHRDTGDQLVDPLVRNPERIERRVDGRTVWARRLSSLFGPGLTTDAGWNFERYGDSYAGTVFAADDPYTPRRTLTIDLAHDPVSAGFRAMTAP